MMPLVDMVQFHEAMLHAVNEGNGLQCFIVENISFCAFVSLWLIRVPSEEVCDATGAQ